MPSVVLRLREAFASVSKHPTHREFHKPCAVQCEVLGHHSKASDQHRDKGEGRREEWGLVLFSRRLWLCMAVHLPN